MTELLKKWAELEPAWCHVDGERASVMTDVGTPLERPRFTAQFHRLGQYEPHILAAVIEAIEARGWWWKLHRYGTWPHLVRGHVGPDPLSAVPRLGEGPTPAAALLTAYLAALEAEAGQ